MTTITLCHEEYELSEDGWIATEGSSCVSDITLSEAIALAIERGTYWHPSESHDIPRWIAAYEEHLGCREQTSIHAPPDAMRLIQAVMDAANTVEEMHPIHLLIECLEYAEKAP